MCAHAEVRAILLQDHALGRAIGVALIGWLIHNIVIARICPLAATKTPPARRRPSWPSRSVTVRPSALITVATCRIGCLPSRVR
jgi:hypothetical protein